MKKLFVFGAISMLALASCSKDVVVSENRDADVINYGVVTNAATKAANIYCNNNKITTFNVWANLTGTADAYIDGDQVDYESSKWINKTGNRYWPDSKGLDFYAVAGRTTNTLTSVGVNTASFNYTVHTDVANQEDVVYAAAKNKLKSSGTTVNLNFRHALSQVVFKAKNTNPNLYVEIEGVSICNLDGDGDYTFGSAATDDKMEHVDSNHEQSTYQNGGRGTWNLGTSTLTDYSVSFNAVKLAGSSDTKSLTYDLTDATNNKNTKAMMLLPQKTTAWAPAAGGELPSATAQTGTYFLVNCIIYNVAGNAVDLTKDVVLWGTDDKKCKQVAIPVAIDWEEGYKYIYTFVFGNGNGGYDPATDNDPVLVPIEFDVTVDEFTPKPQPDIDMQTN